LIVAKKHKNQGRLCSLGFSL